MTYNDFEKLIYDLQDSIRFKSELFDKGYESYYNFPDLHYELIEIIIKKNFGIKGFNWIYWYLYIKSPNPSFVLAYDEFGFPICYDIPSLYDYLCKK